MTLYGLTGGVGMGKSAAAELLARRGLPVVDTDEVAREVVTPGMPGLAQVRAEFGAEFVLADGSLDRQRLAQVIFADEARRRRLEAILHPLIREEWQNRVENWKREGREQGVVVIPLLYETGAEALVSKVICVACSGRLQRERLKSRGWSEAELENRLQAQWPIAQKMDRADYVVWNESSTAVLEMQLKRIV